MYENTNSMTEQETKKRENPQIIFTWTAPLRAYKKRSKGVLRFYIALALLLSLIVIFFGDKILVLPIIAVLFLFYVLTITPPPTITNTITRFGIETAGNTYRFETLSHFYFSKKFDHYVLVIVSRAPYYYHVYLVVKDEETVQKLIDILSDHLIYQQHPQKSFIDKATDLLSRLMPDEEPVRDTAEASV